MEAFTGYEICETFLSTISLCFFVSYVMTLSLSKAT